jgi:hypothetical protein
MTDTEHTMTIAEYDMQQGASLPALADTVVTYRRQRVTGMQRTVDGRYLLRMADGSERLARGEWDVIVSKIPY